jgi:hypothetical protein
MDRVSVVPWRAGVVASLAAFVGCTAAARAGGPHGSVEIGNWKGGAYTDDATGAFTHCAAAATYKNGISLMVSVNVQDAWRIGFVKETWRLQKGEAIPITLTFDARGQFHLYGEALNPAAVLVPMPSDSALIGAFRKANSMMVFAKGQLFQFALTATSQLLPALSSCVAQGRSGRLAEIRIRAPVEPPPQRAPEPARAPAPAATASLAPETPDAMAPPVSPELQIEAIELATNFILAGRLQNPKVLSRAETPAEYASYGAAWRSDEAFGMVKIIAPQGRVTGLDVAAAVAAGDSRACKGKFASGRVSELIDSDVVFRGFATCEDSDGARVAQYFIVPRRKGGFIMFSVVSAMNSEPARAIARDERLTDFRKAAVTAAGQ